MSTSSYHSDGVGSLPGGGDPDYSVLDTWEADTDIDLDGNGVEALEVYNKATTHIDRTTVAGATNTSAADYREIRSFDWSSLNEAGIILHTGAAALGTIDLQEDYSTVRELVAIYIGTGNLPAAGLRGDAAGTNKRFVNCLVADCSTTGDGVNGIVIGTDTTDKAINCASTRNDGNGFNIHDGSGAYNCTSHLNTGDGFFEGDGTTVNDVFGCASCFNGGSDYDTGFDNLQYSCAEDGTHTNGSTTTGSFDTAQTAIELWVAPAISDFAIRLSSDLYQTGNNYSSTTGESSDYVGTVWDAGSDASVGCREFTANDFSDDDACVALYNFENSDLEEDSKSTNDLNAINVPEFDGAIYQQGAGSCEYETSNSEMHQITDTNLTDDFPMKYGGDEERQFTICARFYNLTDQDCAIFSKYSAAIGINRRSFFLEYNAALNELQWWVGYANGSANELIRIFSGETLAQDQWYFVAITHDATSKDWTAYLYNYVSGEKLTSSGTATNVMSADIGPWHVGGLTLFGSPSYEWNGYIDEVVVFNDLKSEEDIDLIRQQRYSTGAIVLIINGIAQTQALDNIDLIQQNVLAIQGMDQAQALDNIDLIQQNTLVIQESSQSQTLDNIDLIQHFVLAIQGMDQAQALENLDLIQQNVLAIQGMDQAQVLENLDLIQQNILAIDSLNQAQTLENLVLSLTIILVINNINQAQAIDNIDLIQQNILVIDPLNQAQGLENLDLTQANVLVINDIDQSQALDNTDLIQQNVLAIDPLDQSQALDNTDLIQQNVLAIDPLDQSQDLENLDLIQQNVLAINPLDQSQGLENLGLIQQNVLVVDAINQSQVLDNVVLQLEIVLQIAGNLQSQTIDNIALIQQNVLAINPLDQGQTLDNITLSTTTILQIAKIIQDQNIESLNFIQQNVLAINPLDQSQDLENLDLIQQNILVINPLDQSQDLENLDLTQANILVINPLDQSQDLENLDLTQQNILNVAGIDQGQVLEQITLDAIIFLQIADILQSQSLGNLDLTQANILEINGLLQSQIINNIIFSLIDGIIKVTFTLKKPTVSMGALKPTASMEVLKPTADLEIE